MSFSKFVDAKDQRQQLFERGEDKIKFEFQQDFNESLNNLDDTAMTEDIFKNIPIRNGPDWDNLFEKSLEECKEICLIYIDNYEDREYWVNMLKQDRRSTRKQKIKRRRSRDHVVRKERKNIK